jgi:hypothetical protein
MCTNTLKVPKILNRDNLGLAKVQWIDSACHNVITKSNVRLFVT